MKNKVILITGASQGLGKELSFQLAKLGAKIALIARTEKLLQEVKEQIIKDGSVAEFFVCDVTDFTQVKTTVEKIILKFGQIDIVINNAGLWTTDEIELKNPQHTLDTFKINSIAPIYICQQTIPIFEKQRSGHFVFINSIAGLENIANKTWATYSASKWALTGYTKALASKYDGSNIKVTSIHPGPIFSNMDINAGDNWGGDHSWEMTTAEVASAVVNTIQAPGNIQVGILEFKKTNWNK